MILRVKAKKRSLDFLAIGDRLLAIGEQQTLNCYDIGWKIFEI